MHSHLINLPTLVSKGLGWIIKTCRLARHIIMQGITTVPTPNRQVKKQPDY